MSPHLPPTASSLPTRSDMFWWQEALWIQSILRNTSSELLKLESQLWVCVGVTQDINYLTLSLPCSE